MFRYCPRKKLLILKEPFQTTDLHAAKQFTNITTQWGVREGEKQGFDLTHLSQLVEKSTSGPEERNIDKTMTTLEQPHHSLLISIFHYSDLRFNSSDNFFRNKYGTLRTSRKSEALDMAWYEDNTVPHSNISALFYSILVCGEVRAYPSVLYSLPLLREKIPALYPRWKQGATWLSAVMRQISATFHLTHSYSLLHARPRTKTQDHSCRYGPTRSGRTQLTISGRFST